MGEGDLRARRRRVVRNGQAERKFGGEDDGRDPIVDGNRRLIDEDSGNRQERRERGGGPVTGPAHRARAILAVATSRASRAGVHGTGLAVRLMHRALVVRRGVFVAVLSRELTVVRTAVLWEECCQRPGLAREPYDRKCEETTADERHALQAL